MYDGDPVLDAVLVEVDVVEEVALRVDDNDFETVDVDESVDVADIEGDGGKRVTSSVWTRLELSVSNPTTLFCPFANVTVAPWDRVAYPTLLMKTTRVTYGWAHMLSLRLRCNMRSVLHCA